MWKARAASEEPYTMRKLKVLSGVCSLLNKKKNKRAGD